MYQPLFLAKYLHHEANQSVNSILVFAALQCSEGGSSQAPASSASQMHQHPLIAAYFNQEPDTVTEPEIPFATFAPMSGAADLLESDRRHISTELPQQIENNWVGFWTVEDWYRIISDPQNGLCHIKTMIDHSRLASIASVRYGIGILAVHIGLVDCWWPITSTFHFHFGELGLTPLDFYVITGLVIGDGELIPTISGQRRSYSVADMHPLFSYLTRFTSKNNKIAFKGFKISNAALKTYYSHMEARFSRAGRELRQRPDFVADPLVELDLRPGSDHSLEVACAFLLYLFGCTYGGQDPWTHYDYVRLLEILLTLLLLPPHMTLAASYMVA